MKRAAALVAAALLVGAAAAPAHAANTPGSAPRDPNALVTPKTRTEPPPGYKKSANQVIAIARRVPKIRAVLRRRHGRWTVDAYEKGPNRWQVSFFDKSRPGSPRKEIGQVSVWDPNGQVLEAWTGFQVPWGMARGYPGAFGRKANALYLWIPLSLIFFVPFFSPRRPLRLLHLDLLVLLGFSVSLAYFNHGKIGISVPAAYPPLAYLLVRMLFAARPQRGPPDVIRLLVPATWLAVALVFLLGFRWALNLSNSNVIDVGYAGVIGADKLADGTHLYGDWPQDNQHGDTYAPVNYYAYVPFEQAFPWSGSWDDLPSAHAAAIFFDALTALLLFLLGRRIRGPTLGIALAYAWAAFPFTLFTLNSNSNDSLVAALVVLALLVAHRPAARGAAVALAGLTKFAPLALAPMLWTYRDPDDRRPQWRTMTWFAVAFGAAALIILLPAFLGSGLQTFLDRTLRFQDDRGSPFSVWGFRGNLDFFQHLIQLAAVLLAVIVAVIPRRRDVVTLAALGSAILIAVQLGVTHWFYLYIVWFLPLVLVALLGRGLEDRTPPPPTPEPEPAREAAGSSQPVAV
jgi:Glycosyltransferase family 87